MERPVAIGVRRLKWLLDYHKKSYTYIDVTESVEVNRAFLKRFPNEKTVPQVMFDGADRGYPVHIGGYTQLEQWLRG